jgi:putative transcriptional regulator
VEKLMKCPICEEAELESSRENWKYTESGLDSVTLVGVLVERCPKCGETMVSIPQMEDLHRRLALELIKKPSFSGKEIRFLRKHLGWSQAQFAEHMAVAKETISRWETSALNMGESPAQLLRLLVFMGEKVQDYEKAVEPRSAKGNLSLGASETGWAPVAA